MSDPAKIDEYIAGFPAEHQELLTVMRETIAQAAPDAEESWGYGVPAFDMNKKHLVYFAGFKNHVGLYPTPSGLEAFADEVAEAGYKTGKATIQFPLGEELPTDLIARIVKFRVEEMSS
jgi:uncharacterized protein YdhG (YjbR/CyaY superfamily)